ncbi:TRCF domain-containing protein, partial [Bifidobacterium scardovii]
QLHQLRGRVGRGRERAYAYFLYDPSKPLTQQSHDRLATIAQNTALGSGFDVAMKDLELRGTGNLLGDEQSGHIEGVGFDLYIRMVSEAVEQYKEPERTEPLAVSIDLPIEASIPVDYIDSDKLRLEAYRKLAAARTEQDLKDLAEELTDRYGKLPEEFETLFGVARLRAKARKLGISEIIAQGRNVRIAKVDPPESIQMRINRIYKGAQYRPVTHTYLIPTPFAGSLGAGPMPGEQVMDWTSDLLNDFAWTPSLNKRQSRL